MGRYESDLPRRYEVTVKYKDSKRKGHTEQIVLDWGEHHDRDGLVVYGLHHAANALREIDKKLGRWNEIGSGLEVIVRDGDRKDKKIAREIKRRRGEREQQAVGAAGRAEPTLADLRTPDQPCHASFSSLQVRGQLWIVEPNDPSPWSQR